MNIVLAITGASGSIYAKKLIENAVLKGVNLYVIFSDTAKEVFNTELDISYNDFISSFKKHGNISFIDNNNYHFKFASGSNRLDCMVVLPCSMGTLGRIAASLSSDLIGRIADVQLKERRRLIICPRETPYNTIHIKNMLTLSECGAIIAPVSPSFYIRPNNIEELVESFTERIAELAQIATMSNKYKW